MTQIALGIFRDATVCRGPDWKYEDQDGVSKKYLSYDTVRFIIGK